MNRKQYYRTLTFIHTHARDIKRTFRWSTQLFGKRKRVHTAHRTHTHTHTRCKRFSKSSRGDCFCVLLYLCVIFAEFTFSFGPLWTFVSVCACVIYFLVCYFSFKQNPIEFKSNETQENTKRKTSLIWTFVTQRERKNLFKQNRNKWFDRWYLMNCSHLANPIHF